VQYTDSFSLYGVVVLGSFGLGLGFLALRSGSRRPGVSLGHSLHRDLERLFSEIGRGLRMLSTPTRFGGMGLLRAKQTEVERQLSELQRRLRHLEDGVRDKYEVRAQRILAQAARFGITLPPP
jgi:hypothetical protein